MDRYSKSPLLAAEAYEAAAKEHRASGDPYRCDVLAEAAERRASQLRFVLARDHARTLVRLQEHS